MRTVTVLLSLFLAFAIVEQTFARKCYKCFPPLKSCDDSKDDPDVCPTDDYGCGKVLSKDKKTVISKGCMYNNDRTGPLSLSKCETQGEYYICGCMNKDFCNSSHRPATFVALGTVVLFVLAKILPVN
ncbi:hypothetical protein M3Y98_00047600 [Aphelenchoides besseyi]|nr:hypothetical protein M3Y98_00047600 [Aphelenchoides besseyi]KAI6198970.1 hypothetical protein M3Y96_00577100 [Aphelenchoides besseyi]